MTWSHWVFFWWCVFFSLFFLQRIHFCVSMELQWIFGAFVDQLKTMALFGLWCSCSISIERSKKTNSSVFFKDGNLKENHTQKTTANPSFLLILQMIHWPEHRFPCTFSLQSFTFLSLYVLLSPDKDITTSFDSCIYAPLHLRSYSLLLSSLFFHLFQFLHIF